MYKVRIYLEGGATIYSYSDTKPEWVNGQLVFNQNSDLAKGDTIAYLDWTKVIGSSWRATGTPVKVRIPMERTNKLLSDLLKEEDGPSW
jgi:hypothetical protein